MSGRMRMLKQGAPYLHLLRTEEHCGHDGNAILPSVRVPTAVVMTTMSVRTAPSGCEPSPVAS
jgi:hypothetical protein